MALSDGQVVDLWARYRHGHGTHERDELAAHYLDLVRRIARSEASARRVDLDDLVNHGYFGLVDAIERFDHRGAFEAFASHRIRGAMMDGLREDDWVSPYARARARDLDTALDRLTHQLGHRPTEAEMAKHLGIDLATLRHRLRHQHSTRMIYLDNDGPGPDGSAPVQQAVGLDNLRDLQAEIEPSIDMAQLRADLAAALVALPEPGRTVLVLIYVEVLTFKQIGDLFGVAQSKVSQMKAEAICELQDGLAG